MRKAIGQITFNPDDPKTPYYVVGFCKRCNEEFCQTEQQLIDFKNKTLIDTGAPQILPWYTRLYQFLVRLKGAKFVLPDVVQK